MAIDIITTSTRTATRAIRTIVQEAANELGAAFGGITRIVTAPFSSDSTLPESIDSFLSNQIAPRLNIFPIMVGVGIPVYWWTDNERSRVIRAIMAIAVAFIVWTAQLVLTGGVF